MKEPNESVRRWGALPARREPPSLLLPLASAGIAGCVRRCCRGLSTGAAAEWRRSLRRGAADAAPPANTAGSWDRVTTLTGLNAGRRGGAAAEIGVAGAEEACRSDCAVETALVGLRVGQEEDSAMQPEWR